mmetsp:Transcript_97803/g.310172  ORF Transcript_97803/g.310172 Transcript_97803/m.310172 type:complete len:233 (-) Transcript_97803:52-750(-)
MLFCCPRDVGQAVAGSCRPAGPGHAAAVAGSALAPGEAKLDADDALDGEPSGEFVVGAVRVPAGASPGLVLLCDGGRGRVVVCGVDEAGPWGEWNRLHPECQCETGDLIVGVNGKGFGWNTFEALMAKRDEDSSIWLLIMKPRENRIKVSKAEGEIMGLVLFTEVSGACFVKGVMDGGPISRWNEENPSRQVRSLDLLCTVNGVGGPNEALIEELRASTGIVELVLKTHMDC